MVVQEHLHEPVITYPFGFLIVLNACHGAISRVFDSKKLIYVDISLMRLKVYESFKNSLEGYLIRCNFINFLRVDGYAYFFYSVMVEKIIDCPVVVRVARCRKALMRWPIVVACHSRQKNVEG